MPQLVTADFLPQLFWLFLTLGALYFIMARIALPKIGGAIEQRHGRIATDLAEAERLKAQTEKAIADYEQALAEARGKAHAIAQENRRVLNEELGKEAASFEARLDAKVAAADAAIAKSKAAALAHVTTVAEDVTSDLVSRLIGGKPTKDAIAKAVAAAMKN